MIGVSVNCNTGVQNMTRAITVWNEIPVANLDRAVSFYNKVFGYEMTIDKSGPNPMAVLGSQMEVSGGHLYPGKPSGDGPTVHLALPDSLEDGARRCTEAGGEVLGDPIQIPSGRFVYARDTEGNSIGLFEAAA